jgi:hypothetical protein
MSDPKKPPAIGELVASQRLKAIEALSSAGLAPDPITAAALFEIGTNLLVRQGLDPAALRARLEEIVLNALAAASSTLVH